MRLLEIQQDGTLSLTKDLLGDDSVPAYAILSHTWQEDEEVTFGDLQDKTGRDKAGYDKIRSCAQQAQCDGLRYIWVDTCCINKADAIELQDAINSMFRWYGDAARCYVFLSDVPATDAPAWEQAFQNSRWFTRGWTLQELLAPRVLSFFSRDWKYLGDRHELRERVRDATGIPVSALAGPPLDHFSVEERLSWSNGRRTTRKEDRAYSLLGLFNIFMSTIYGEGEENAFRRLNKGIDEALHHDSQQTYRAPAEAQSTSAALAARKACYSIPFPRNRYFVGRKNELAELERRLLVDQECQKMSIVGLGGSGKTQVALQFAYMVKETRPELSIFWLPAVSMESFEQACAEVAKALGLSQTTGKEEDGKELVKRHLSAVGKGQRWLLVLDNADDPDILFGTKRANGIVDYLPESEHGTTVYTTRIQETAVSLTHSDVMELGPMDQQDAEDFLKKSLVKKSLLIKRGAMAELLDELACLPLAIRQATAYLNMNKASTIAKYLHLLRNTQQDLSGIANHLSKEFRDETRYENPKNSKPVVANAVAATWALSFSQICERDAAAADLLVFMSCIEWKAIPRSLLPSMQSEERMEEAINTLCGYSFLASREGDGQEEEEEEDGRREEWYDMHRLVHLATRIWTAKHESVAEAKEKALQHITEVFPSDDYANRAVWRGYLPHALRILGCVQSCQGQTKSELSLLVGRCLRVDGRIREAVVWLEESHRLRGTLKEDDTARLLSEHELARAYEADGQVKKAIALLEQVVAIKEKVLEEEHPDRLASQHELARIYQADGQVKRAVELLEYIIKVEEKVLAEEHPSRLTAQHTLAIAYKADGQVKKAMVLLEQVVAVKEKVLAKEHPDRLASQHVLAIAYQADGQIKKAVAMLEQGIAVQEKVLAEEHPNQLASQHALALAYIADGQVKKAVARLEQNIKVVEKVLAEEHPNRLTTQHTLAIAYEADGQIKKAVALLEHVVAVKARVLQDNHPSRLVSIEALKFVKGRAND